MKKFTIITLVAGIALLASCKNESAKDNYVASLPENTFIAAKVNLGAILAKAAESDKFADLKENYTAELSSEIESRNLRKLFTSIIDNPNESGIDFDKPAYLGVTGDNNFYVVAVASICNEESLKNALNTASDELGGGIDIENRNGINYISIDDEDLVAFNGSRIVIAYSDNNRRRHNLDLEELITDNTLPAGPGFAEFTEKNSDAAVWADYEQVFKMVEEEEKEIAEYISAQFFEGTSITADFNFNKGSLDMILNATYSGLAKALIEKHSIFFDPKLAGFLPKNPLFVAGYSVTDFSGILDMIPAAVLDIINEEMEDSPVKLDDFGGSVAMAVLPYDRQGYAKACETPVADTVEYYPDYYSSFYSENRKNDFSTPDFVFAMTGTKKLYRFLQENLDTKLGAIINYTDGVIVIRTTGTSEYTDTEGHFYKSFESSPLFETLAQGGAAVDFNQFDFGFLNGEYELGDSTAEEVCGLLYNNGIFDLLDSFIVTMSMPQQKVSLNLTDRSKNSLAVILDAALALAE